MERFQPGMVLYHSGSFDLNPGHMTYFSELPGYSRKMPPFPLSLISDVYCRNGCDYLTSCTEIKAFILSRDLNLIHSSSETLMNLMLRDDTIEFLKESNADGFVTNNSFVPGGKVFWLLLDDTVKYTHTVELSCEKSVTSIFDLFFVIVLSIFDVVLAIAILLAFLVLRVVRHFKKYGEFVDNSHSFTLPAKTDGNLRVISWNVHFFRNHLMVYTYENCLKVLREYKADLLFLQEAYTMWPFCPSETQLAKDLNKLGFGNVVHDLKSGLLVAYRATINVKRVSVEPLSETRSFIQVAVGDDAAFVNVHLEVSNEKVRLEQIHTILDFLSAQRVLIMGDLNTLDRTDYSDKEWRKLLYTNRKYTFEPLVVSKLESDGFVDLFANKRVETSIHKRRVDFAFAKHIDCECAFVNTNCAYSDHRPLMVDLSKGPLSKYNWPL